MCMESQEYVFEEKAESVGDEIIIGDVEFKLETNKGNTSFGEIEPQGDISVGAYPVSYTHLTLPTNREV